MIECVCMWCVAIAAKRKRHHKFKRIVNVRKRIWKQQIKKTSANSLKKKNNNKRNMQMRELQPYFNWNYYKICTDARFEWNAPRLEYNYYMKMCVYKNVYINFHWRCFKFKKNVFFFRLITIIGANWAMAHLLRLKAYTFYHHNQIKRLIFVFPNFVI